MDTIRAVAFGVENNAVVREIARNARREAAKAHRMRNPKRAKQLEAEATAKITRLRAVLDARTWLPIGWA